MDMLLPMRERGLKAHTKNSQGKEHLLVDHLCSVADKAKAFVKNFYNGQFTSLAWLIGLLHDLGKAHPSFQEYLQAQQEGKSCLKMPHSPWGAAFVHLALNRFPLQHELTLPVAGHHAGLSEYGDLTAKIKNYSLEQERVKEIITLMHSVFQVLLRRGIPAGILQIPGLTPVQRELLIRMLFSALVDADRLDTEAHFYPQSRLLRQKNRALAELAEKLQDAQQELIAQSRPSKVNNIRRQVYEACVKKASLKPGFFRLTVPTGGGKTRSVLAFALNHALINGQERVIFALPYTSIIDQTAGVYRDILGEDAVLEHHSQVLLPDDDEDEDEIAVRLKLAAENWDMPLVVTTTVQFFESLFNNSPAKCRKLHRIAGSVVVLDEAQSLPVELLRPTMQVLRDLVENYGVTVVLSTATQPALQGEYLPELQDVEITEIVPDYKQHFAQLKRVYYERLVVTNNRLVSVDEFAEEILKHQQVLVILNTRKKSVELIKALVKKGCREGLFYLSTFLCATHRRQVLREVHCRLDENRQLEEKKPVRLVSTQVVEAGVDLDFPVVFRAIGPLDRIVQAAGRCNREGGLPNLGKVVIFELTDERSPRGPYKAGLEIAKMLLAEQKSLEVLTKPEIYETYFTRLYRTVGNDLDARKIQEKRGKLNYPATAAEYRLIKESTLPVLVRYGDYARVLNEWTRQPGKSNWRKLQPYIVNVFEWEAKQLLRDGLLSSVTEGLYIWEGSYDNLLGIGRFEFDPADLIV
ncbi:MAG TPA: CRISPR-associated helicase Cas3' [Bacillota bacterium]|nr:CRISPR-associated helicase Cas3' [Bacillota bacterium]